jgi:periplasmic divalent cation tolerance protein
LIPAAVVRGPVPTAYITAPPAAAEALARDLVTDRSAACVDRLPSRSTYRSDGGVHDDEAVLLLAKTTDDCYPDLVDRVERLHPHDVPWPCIERLEGGRRRRDREGRAGVTEPGAPQPL